MAKRKPAATTPPVAPPKKKTLAAILVQALYDYASPDQQRKRRSLANEFGHEESVLKTRDRYEGIKFTRDLYRNSTACQSLVQQVANQVIGTEGGKCSVHTEDEQWNLEAADYFNSRWSKDCYARMPMRFNELLKFVLNGCMIDGFLGFAVDTFDLNDGKLWVWEADMFAEIEPKEWQQNAVKNGYFEADADGKIVPLTQKNGVVCDRRGRVTHFVLTNKSPLADENLPYSPVAPVKFADAAVISVAVVRLFANRWRTNQLLGVPKIAPIALELEQMKEMRSRELDTAMVAASMSAAVTRSGEGALAAALRAAGENPEALLDELDPDTPDVQPSAPQYQVLESLTGGKTVYLDPADKVEPLNFGRPNMAVSEFYKSCLQVAGSGMGLAASYAHMSADKSYFAFRGDMLLTWPTFRALQKKLEYDVCDWVFKRVIQHAIEAGELPPAPIGWRSRVTWLWPVMPEPDERKHFDAVGSAISQGLALPSDYLGADWKAKVDEWGRQMAYIASKKVDAAAPAAEPETEEEGNDDEN